MSDTAIRTIGTRKNNAELMHDCAKLGYLDGSVLDMTYGLGRFWKIWQPFPLWTNDLFTDGAEFHYDFTALPAEWAGKFDAVVFDPPYKLNGTGGSHPSDAGYGVANKGSTIARHRLIRDGMVEGERVLAPGGHLLVKCQDQVCSGRKEWQTFEFATFGLRLGLRLLDQLHVSSYRAQPAGRRQVHSRVDYSTLLVFLKDK